MRLCLKINSNEVRKILHDFRKYRDQGDVLEEQVFGRYRQLGPTHADLSSSEINDLLDRLGQSSFEEVLLTGEYLKGVYCDLEGTLIWADGTIDVHNCIQLKDPLRYAQEVFRWIILLAAQVGRGLNYLCRSW